MSLTEESRYELYQGLRESLGSERASTLMDLLPPVGWADVATKRDLDQLGDSLRGDMATLGTELRGEITTLGAELRGEITTLETALRGEITTMGSGLQGGIHQTRAEFFREQRNQTIAIIGANATIMGILLAAFRFL